jgi:hypothetical protein
MAARRNAQAAELMEAEQAERAENADINEAIARTDSEVFTDALGDEPLEDDAGTELEDMGDGLEGDELEEEEAEEPQPEGEQQAGAAGDQEGAQQAEGEENAAGDDAETGGDGGQPLPQADQRPPPSIPPRVLREAREQWRTEAEELRAQNRDLQMRLDNLVRQPAPQPQPPPQTQQRASQPPDQFADPAGHDAWLLEEGERRAEARFEARWQQQQQLQQRDMETRLNEGLASMASGPRSYEFNVAYRDLVSLNKTPENAALVRRLVANPETAGQAILDWWETTSNPDYIEYHRDVVRQTYSTPAGRPQRNGFPRQNGSRIPVQNRQAPRHEVRLPRSLSEATGGRSQHVNDPDMFDGAEDSIFAYGARR